MLSSHASQRRLQSLHGHDTRQVAAAVYRPGESLPSLRNMAIELRVNPNTVQRAYDQLERDGLIFSKRGDTVNEVLEVLKFREPLYRAAAQIIIDTAHQSIPQVIKEILGALEFKEAANLGG